MSLEKPVKAPYTRLGNVIGRLTSSIEMYGVDVVGTMCPNALAMLGVWVALPDNERKFGDHFVLYGLIVFGLSLLSSVGLIYRTRKKNMKSYETQEKLFKTLASNELLNLQVAQLENDLSYAKSAQFALMEKSLTSQIRVLSETLKFGNDERVSIYMFNERHFIRVGRYATSPVYGEGGRNIYPLNVGCIGEAWANVQAVERNLPDPVQDMQGYIGRCSIRFRMASKDIHKMRMKARCYIARRMTDDHGNHVAVLVLESLNPQINCDPTHLSVRRFEKQVGYLLRTLKEILPTRPEEELC
jgi:hypothetical protein